MFEAGCLVVYLATLWNLLRLVGRLEVRPRHRTSAIVLALATSGLALFAGVSVLLVEYQPLDWMALAVGLHLWLGTGFVNRFDFQHAGARRDPVTHLMALVILWPAWFLGHRRNAAGQTS